MVYLDENFVYNCIDKQTNIISEVSKMKAALSSRPKDLKGDLSHIDLAFYQQTETAFFQILESVAQSGQLADSLKKTWHQVLEQKALALFDQFALQSAEESHLQRRVQERKRLSLFFHPNSKAFKNFFAKRPKKEHAA